jgi:hypothetical protein
LFLQDFAVPRCRLGDAKLACSLETAAQDFASSTLR